jgi:class 3 adenylate cyclase
VDEQQDMHQTICMVDIEGFGGRDRTRPNYVAIRNGLFESVRQAFAVSRIPWADCYRESAGDSILALAPATVAKSAFAGTLPGALVAALCMHNEAHPPDERIRLRLALHAGEVTFDAHGVAAPAIVHAARLLDARPLKDALANSPGPLAMIVSDWIL